jgi:hypothetical protein
LKRIAIAAGSAVIAIGVAVIALAVRAPTTPFVPPPSFRAAVVRGAILGAPKARFDSSLGKATLENQMMGNVTTYGYASCPSSDSAQFAVTFAGDLAIAIAWKPCGPEPTTEQALALAKELTPADAVAAPASPTRLTSSTLARNVPRSWFEDCTGNDVAAGTFSMSATSTNGFDVTVGTCTAGS